MVWMFLWKVVNLVGVYASRDIGDSKSGGTKRPALLADLLL